MKKTTKADKVYMGRVAELGCIICQMPAEIHHIRSGMGLGQRNSHRNVLPLCHRHHRTGAHGEAIHAGIKTWEYAHGSEAFLLNKVQELMGES